MNARNVRKDAQTNIKLADEQQMPIKASVSNPSMLVKMRAAAIAAIQTET